jgi:nucleotide-binding universal stress UspA family protein
MFHRILLPVDLTDKHEPALNIAADLLEKSQGELTLLHVIELIPGLDRQEEKTFYGRLEDAAQKHLDGLASICKKRRLAGQAKILYGNRAAETARFARDWSADLIVLTAPRLDPADPAGSWGSLSYKISLLASCPVLLVK